MHVAWINAAGRRLAGLPRRSRPADQYFPKGTDLRVHGPKELAAVASELNDRPRKTLGWATPAEQLEAFLRGGAD